MCCAGRVTLTNRLTGHGENKKGQKQRSRARHRTGRLRRFGASLVVPTDVSVLNMRAPAKFDTQTAVPEQTPFYDCGVVYDVIRQGQLKTCLVGLLS